MTLKNTQITAVFMGRLISFCLRGEGEHLPGAIDSSAHMVASPRSNVQQVNGVDEDDSIAMPDCSRHIHDKGVANSNFRLDNYAKFLPLISSMN